MYPGQALTVVGQLKEDEIIQNIIEETNIEYAPDGLISL